jgi:hypothetical protein
LGDLQQITAFWVDQAAGLAELKLGIPSDFIINTSSVILSNATGISQNLTLTYVQTTKCLRNKEDPL